MHYQRLWYQSMYPCTDKTPGIRFKRREDPTQDRKGTQRRIDPCHLLGRFGNYLLGTQSTHGGFLPVFWNAPTAYMHAATDIGCVVEWVRSHFTLTSDENDCLAVLHNRNKMVTTLPMPARAFAEICCEDSHSSAKVRRLHLIVIDLNRSRNVGKRVYWQFQRVDMSARYVELNK